ncbi:MAG: NAD-dependent epimerase/dehydratase family protein [Candidatus Binatia bacterium]
MSVRSYLITGGAGFLGSALVRRLVHDGNKVRVLDNKFRGAVSRVDDLGGEFEFVHGDVRDPQVVRGAVRKADSVCHLAFINGTKFFYTQPELVLEVAVKGIVNVLDACIAEGAHELILVSSSEVYQTPLQIPTDEMVPLSIPDPLNPRYSYAAGKIISEAMAINYGRSRIGRVVVCRPHNVYGPDMGWEHVVPQFIVRMRDVCRSSAEPEVLFPIQGTGEETRAFVFIDDFIDGLMLAMAKGEHLGIYNVGTTEEISMESVAHAVGQHFGRRVKVVPGQLPAGSPLRRCPDISKLAALGYKPKIRFLDGLPIVAKWYDENASRIPIGGNGG